jgi:hypothetical protein
MPNEQEDDCIQVVEVEAGPSAAYKHDGEYGDEQDYQGPIDPIHFVEQWFRHVGGCWKESVPLKKKNNPQLIEKKNQAKGRGGALLLQQKCVVFEKKQ